MSNGGEQEAERLAAQYATAHSLLARIETHARYSVGPPLEAAVGAALALSGAEDLLDLGTGTGGFPARLRREGHRGRLVGVDASAGMVQHARAHALAGVGFLVADARRLPLGSMDFDVVTARHMLYHVPGPLDAIREARRVLRPGGRFLAVTNARGYMAEYRDAVAEAAARTCDSEALAARRERLVTGSAAAFDEMDGAAMIRDAFGGVRVTLIDSALMFDQVEPVLRYFDSTRSLHGLDAQDWSRLRAALAEVIADRLRRGPWRVSKRVALLHATREADAQ